MSNTTEQTRMGKGPQDVVFFGSIDRKGGKSNEGISSSYPAWYHETQVEELREECDSIERALSGGYVPKDSVHEVEDRKRKLKDKLDQIDDSRPRLNAAQQAWLKKAAGELENNVGSSLFSYDDMNHGAASPHDEMRRMTRPCIKIDPLLAEKCNCRTDENGMVSRNEASRALKIANKLLGQPTNTEFLRHKMLTCRMKRVEPFVGNDFGVESGRQTDAQDASRSAG